MSVGRPGRADNGSTVRIITPGNRSTSLKCTAVYCCCTSGSGARRKGRATVPLTETAVASTYPAETGPTTRRRRRRRRRCRAAGADFRTPNASKVSSRCRRDIAFGHGTYSRLRRARHGPLVDGSTSTADTCTDFRAVPGARTVFVSRRFYARPDFAPSQWVPGIEETTLKRDRYLPSNLQVRTVHEEWRAKTSRFSFTFRNCETIVWPTVFVFNSENRALRTGRVNRSRRAGRSNDQHDIIYIYIY